LAKELFAAEAATEVPEAVKWFVAWTKRTTDSLIISLIQSQFFKNSIRRKGDYILDSFDH